MNTYIFCNLYKNRTSMVRKVGRREKWRGKKSTQEEGRTHIMHIIYILQLPVSQNFLRKSLLTYKNSTNTEKSTVFYT